jgi:glycine dehydrogenase subunit 1
MVDQLPNLGREAEMLATMGMTSMEDLFADIPDEVRMKGPLPLRDPQSEEEIIADARRLLGSNIALGERPSFLGAGLYRNYVPAAVFQLITRGEFLTSYTPYQPEVSQGMLQAMLASQLRTSPSTTAPLPLLRRLPAAFVFTTAKQCRKTRYTSRN